MAMLTFEVITLKFHQTLYPQLDLNDCRIWVFFEVVLWTVKPSPRYTDLQPAKYYL